MPRLRIWVWQPTILEDGFELLICALARSFGPLLLRKLILRHWHFHRTAKPLHPPWVRRGSDIRLWDVAVGKEIGRLEGHKSWVGSLVFWPDGKKLASSSADQTIRTWDIASRKCLDVLRGHLLEVWRLALLSDNRTLISGSKDGAVCFWDDSPSPTQGSSAPRSRKNVINWSFAPEGKSVLVLKSTGASGAVDGTHFQQKFPLMEMGTNVYASLFSPDGCYLTVSRTNGNLQVWDMLRAGSFASIDKFNRPDGAVTFSRKGKSAGNILGKG